MRFFFYAESGLRRCGKSCRLRWLNYLRPDIKHGGFTEEEDNIICTLYKTLGSRWSIIASQLPGRTDNDVHQVEEKLLARNPNSTNKLNINTTNHVLLQKKNTTNHVQLSSSPCSVSIAKGKGYGYDFSAPFNQGSTILPKMGVGLEHNSNSMTLLHDPIPFSLPAAALGVSDFSPNLNSYSVSSSQAGSTSSSSQGVPNSYSIPIENNCISWSGNGASEIDAFLMDFSYGSSYDFLNGYGFQDKMVEASPNLANFPSTKVSGSENLQNVTY
ncbi:uncharacterized protein LOC143886146 [Tasmannia lanceolata]|uniref:uncharacterized protein LOC143886146 n=1 Tax=Tasmannia lanceolata TaxID=3420 RepID=UPI004063361B